MAQDELFDPTALPVGMELLMPVEEQRKRFTAERVALNEQRYRGIVELLGAGQPMRVICKAFTVSHHTVKVIREREPELVATEKQKQSRLMGYAIRLCIEGLIEDLENGVPHWDSEGAVTYRPVQTQVKGILAGILSDKKALIDGEASVIIRHESGRLPSLADVKRMIEALPAEQPILEIPGSTDCQSGEKAEETP